MTATLYQPFRQADDEPAIKLPRSISHHGARVVLSECEERNGRLRIYLDFSDPLPICMSSLIELSGQVHFSLGITGNSGKIYLTSLDRYCPEQQLDYWAREFLQALLRLWKSRVAPRDVVVSKTF